jgi:hypothetical protein
MPLKIASKITKKRQSEQESAAVPTAGYKNIPESPTNTGFDLYSFSVNA